MTDFAALIAPFDADTFRAQFFGKRPLHIRREGAAGPAVLGWQRFNEVLALTPYWNEDTLKVYFRSRAALRENYCDTADLRPGTKAPADPAKVKALLGVGASLIANHIHRVCPEVAAIAHVLEREFAARVAANAYCSFKGVQAFQTHFDLHDVFALQVEGEKTWHVYESRADAPVTPLPPGDEVEKWLTASRGRLLFEADMKPGDILYLPRGQYHDALTGAQASLHVSFGVTPATGLGLFKLLEGAATVESAFRQYLPDARNEAALRERLAGLAERIKTIMTSPAFATDVLNHQRSLAGAKAEYELPAQSPATWYQIARRAQVVRRDSGYVAITEQGEVALGATHSTVEWMLKQRLFSLGDALARHANMDAAELRSVLGKLTAAGVIVETELRSEGRSEGNA
jgi:lysine-specific demethylase/histidyl-hydroxylase NO66